MGRSVQSGLSIGPGTSPPCKVRRFLCDEMLGRLARYLRAAGYDTVLAAGGLPDSVWVELAQSEARLLLTCDRLLGEACAAEGLVLNLQQGNLDRQAETLRRRCQVDWLWRPFSRCLVDNTLLAHAAGTALADGLPDVDPATLRICPDCGRVYWAGSHYRRMQNRLRAWRHS